MQSNSLSRLSHTKDERPFVMDKPSQISRESPLGGRKVSMLWSLAKGGGLATDDQ